MYENQWLHEIHWEKHGLFVSTNLTEILEFTSEVPGWLSQLSICLWLR